MEAIGPPLLLDVDATGMLPLPDAAVETEALLNEVVWVEGVLSMASISSRVSRYCSHMRIHWCLCTPNSPWQCVHLLAHQQQQAWVYRAYQPPSGYTYTLHHHCVWPMMANKLMMQLCICCTACLLGAASTGRYCCTSAVQTGLHHKGSFHNAKVVLVPHSQVGH